jgi:uncharacterized protein (DUF433 family)
MFHMKSTRQYPTRVHRSFRLPAATMARLDERARDHAVAETSLVERYLEEGLRQDEHPGIVFIDGAAGRRPRLAGTGLDVWEVVETFLAEERSVESTATYLGVSPSVVRVAVGYYADHQDEIGAWIERNQRIADKAEAAARQVQALME